MDEKDDDDQIKHSHEQTIYSTTLTGGTGRSPMTYAPIPPDVESIARSCVDVGIHVHRQLGPGFRELIYSRAFCLELDARRISFECEKPLLVRYKHWHIPGQKIDLLVGGKVLVAQSGAEATENSREPSPVVFKDHGLAARTHYQFQRACSTGRVEAGRTVEVFAE
jgi:GxxExxY protein